MKRRIKPKVLLLNARSARSVARLKAALAFTEKTIDQERANMGTEYKLTRRAEEILDLLRQMA